MPVKLKEIEHFKPAAWHRASSGRGAARIWKVLVRGTGREANRRDQSVKAGS